MATPDRFWRGPARTLLRVLALCSLPLVWLLALVTPRIRAGQSERFGWIPRVSSRSSSRSGNLPEPDAADPTRPRCWLHGASAGDISALVPTAERLTDSCRLIGTTMTDTGRGTLDRHRYLFEWCGYCPWDTPLTVWGSRSALKPDVLVVEYTELWPELLHQCHHGGTLLVWHNGYIGAKNLAKYQGLFALWGNILHYFDVLLMRDDESAERALSLGAPADRLIVTGNTKFDRLPNPTTEETRRAMRRSLGLQEGSAVLVAGSTHEGEEQPLFQLFRLLKSKHHGLRLIIAPRYVARAGRVLEMARVMQLEAELLGSEGPPTEVTVVPTMGRLAELYGIADVAFVGGSLIPRGGQNILEPAATGCPVVFGPYTQNINAIVTHLLGRGGLQVMNGQELVSIVDRLLSSPDERAHLGRLAFERVREIRGAADRNALEIQRLLAARA